MYRETEKKIGADINENIAWEQQLEAAIRTKQKYLEAIQEQTLRKIHSLPVQIYFPTNTLKNLSKYMSAENRKEVDKEIKDSVACFKHIFKKFVGDYKYKLTKVLCMGYEQCGYEVGFKINKTEFSLTIPVVENIRAKNREWMVDGKYLVCVKDGPCSYKCIGKSYDIDELHTFIDAYFEEE